MEPAYLEGIAALTVALSGHNVNAIINLLTGIQWILWVNTGLILAVCVLLGRGVWKWK